MTSDRRAEGAFVEILDDYLWCLLCGRGGMTPEESDDHFARCHREDATVAFMKTLREERKKAGKGGKA